MGKSQPETLLVKKIKSVLELKHGLFLIKIHGGQYQQNGIPDLIGCYKGHFIGLEVKVPEREDNTTKLQEHTLQEIREAGGVAVVVTSIEEAEAAISHLLEPDKCPVCNRTFEEYGSVLRDPEEQDSFRLCIPCHNASSPPESRILDV